MNNTSSSGRRSDGHQEDELLRKCMKIIQEALYDEDSRIQEGDVEEEEENDNMSVVKGGRGILNGPLHEQSKKCQRIASSILKAEATLQKSILESFQHHEEEMEGVLGDFKKATEASQVAVRSYLRSLYETDKSLVEKLKEAQIQLKQMTEAQAQPVSLLDSIRYAHRVRPVSSAPVGWQPGLRGLDFLPPNPYMPVNECIAASQLRKHHLEVQRANRERQIKRKRRLSQGSRSLAEKQEEEEEGKMEELLMRQISDVGAPPPGWQPGQSIGLDPQTIKHLKEEMALKKQQQQRQGLSSTSAALPPPVTSPSKPVALPPPPQQQQMMKKPKRQTFMDEDSSEEE